MPFTFAHPAAAVPLLRPLGRYGVLSALVIGSLMPDLGYFLPFNVARYESHSLLGLLWFCLPSGMISYLLFHILLKGPLLTLLPDFVFCRLGAYAENFQSLPAVPWTAVIVSLLFGAATHLLWDAFTHDHTLAVTTLPVLRLHVFSIGVYPVYVYKLLQHVSTVVGLSLLSWWSWRWLKAAAARTVALPLMLSSTQRRIAIGIILLVPLGLGLWAGMKTPAALTGVLALRSFVDRTVFATLPAFVLMVIVYSAAWQIWRWRGKSAADPRNL